MARRPLSPLLNASPIRQRSELLRCFGCCAKIQGAIVQLWNSQTVGTKCHYPFGQAQGRMIVQDESDHSKSRVTDVIAFRCALLRCGNQTIHYGTV